MPPLLPMRKDEFERRWGEFNARTEVSMGDVPEKPSDLVLWLAQYSLYNEMSQDELAEQEDEVLRLLMQFAVTHEKRGTK